MSKSGLLLPPFLKQVIPSSICMGIISNGTAVRLSSGLYARNCILSSPGFVTSFGRVNENTFLLKSAGYSVYSGVNNAIVHGLPCELMKSTRFEYSSYSSGNRTFISVALFSAVITMLCFLFAYINRLFDSSFISIICPSL